MFKSERHLFLTPVVTASRTLLLLGKRLLVLRQLLLRRALTLEHLCAINGARDVFWQLAAANQAKYDAGADNGREHEAVHGVPVGSPATVCGTC